MDYRDLLRKYIDHSDSRVLLDESNRPFSLFEDDEWETLRVLAGMDKAPTTEARPAPAYELPEHDTVFLGKKDGQWPVTYFQFEGHAIHWLQEQRPAERRRLWRVSVELLEELTVVTPAPRLVTVLRPPSGYAKKSGEENDGEPAKDAVQPSVPAAAQGE